MEMPAFSGKPVFIDRLCHDGMEAAGRRRLQLLERRIKALLIGTVTGTCKPMKRRPAA